MKKRLFTFVLSLSVLLAVYIPSQARSFTEDSKSFSPNPVSASAVRDVRYVRVRGKRYKVWYSTYYRKGKRYVKIHKIRRA